MDPLTDSTDHLRVLIANERKARLALVRALVVALGHEVIAREIDVEDVGTVTTRQRPDVALVGLGENSEHALELIDKIVREAACPVTSLRSGHAELVVADLRDGRLMTEVDVVLADPERRRHLHAMRRRQGGGESAKDACSRLVRPEGP